MLSQASRLRLARRALAITQLGLAKAIDVSRSSIAQWERNDGSKPSAKNLARLALTLDCSFEWLATGRGSRYVGKRNDLDDELPGVVLSHFAKDDSEEHLLNAFRDIDSWDKELVLGLIDSLGRRKVYIARRRNTRHDRSR